MYSLGLWINISMDYTGSLVVIGILIIIVLVQLEFIFHLSQYIPFQLSTLLYTAFGAMFLIALYYAYKIHSLEKEASHYSYHTYKKTDRFEEEKRLQT